MSVWEQVEVLGPHTCLLVCAHTRAVDTCVWGPVLWGQLWVLWSRRWDQKPVPVKRGWALPPSAQSGHLRLRGAAGLAFKPQCNISARIQGPALGAGLAVGTRGQVESESWAGTQPGPPCGPLHVPTCLAPQGAGPTSSRSSSEK